MKNFEFNSKNNLKKSSNFSVEAEINNIYRSLSDKFSKSCMVVKEKPARYSLCKGLISVYTKDELRKHGWNRAKANPIVKLAFYESIYQPNRLGSVAIYGASAEYYYFMLRRSRTLFGYEIEKIEKALGRRTYLDVTLRA